MKDRLEEFVREHSEAFDLFEPGPELWARVEKNIQPKRSIPWRGYLYRAAAVLVIAGATLLSQQLWMHRAGHQAPKTAAVELQIPELQEAEMYYSGMISAKLEEVKPYLAGNPALENELHADLSELDSVYISLKSDLKDNIANHEVIEAMIQNYRLRISILEEMLQFLAEQNDEEKLHNTEQI